MVPVYQGVILRAISVGGIMNTKSVLFGASGLIIGGVIVGIGAAILNKPVEQKNTSHSFSSISLEGKTDDDYDKAFLNAMIEHHEMAMEMAKQSATNAKHTELKQFSNELLTQGEAEIKTMRQWRVDWGYGSDSASHGHH